jgi:SAM-dependent methyltransferase
MPKGEPRRGDTTASALNVDYRTDRIATYLSGRWLDYGCADGGYAEALLARGLDSIVGVDVESPRIDLANARHLPNATFEVFDGRSLPFDDASFDGAFVNEVLEHVVDEAASLDELHRVIRPGGYLVVISPNRWFPFEGHGVEVGKFRAGGYPLVSEPHHHDRLDPRLTAFRCLYAHRRGAPERLRRVRRSPER